VTLNNDKRIINANYYRFHYKEHTTLHEISLIICTKLSQALLRTFNTTLVCILLAKRLYRSYPPRHSLPKKICDAVFQPVSKWFLSRRLLTTCASNSVHLFTEYCVDWFGSRRTNGMDTLSTQYS